nr:hypothetical protein [Tanacetum cinerariifolium]
MLAPGNYIQWKSRIKRYIDTKPNRELIHYCLENPPYELDNDIYSTVDAYPNACEMWKAIERLKQGESINVQDLETNFFWEFGKFTSLDVDACPNACEMWKAIERLKQESLESYYSRFYKMMNELTINQCKVTNHQVNVQFLLQLQPEWQRFVTLVKQSQELKHVSYHKLYDILKQDQHKVNEIRAEKIARIANPLALVAQQQQVNHPQTHPTHYNQHSSTRTHQAATRNRGKAIVNSPQSIYDQEPSMVDDDDETSKEKEIDKLMALISLSRSRKSTNLPTTTFELHQIQVMQIRIILQGFIKMLGMKVKGVVMLLGPVADWKNDTDDESDDQELEAHYMYMAKIQEVSPDAVDSGPIFDTKPEQK